MATTRIAASRALSRVTVGSSQARQLHLTGPVGVPVRTASIDKSGVRASANVDNFQTESKPRGFPADSQTAERLRKPGTRSFSSSDSSYGTPWTVEFAGTNPDHVTFHAINIPTAFSPTNQSRQFNSSRNNKAVGDSSTIDFAHLPIFPTPSMEAEFEDIRVPLLPHISRTDGLKAPMASEIEEVATSPEIVVVSGESTHIAGGPTVMAESHDTPKELDFQGVAKQLALGLERDNDEAVRRAKGLVKQVWTGFVDDLFGQKQSSKP